MKAADRRIQDEHRAWEMAWMMFVRELKNKGLVMSGEGV